MNHHLVLVRHGESRWNLCNRFTGWVDVPLSEGGILEAQRCAIHCREFNFNIAFSSALERAHETLLIVLSQQNRTGIVQHGSDPRYGTWFKKSNQCGGEDIPIFTSPVLNERYYGTLQGMEKDAAAKKYGADKVLAWRRSFAARPPRGESLKDTLMRIHPYFAKFIEPKVKRGETVLLAGHGNTLRAIIKHAEGISNEDIAFIDLPEATPIVYEYKRGKYTRVMGDYRMGRPLR